MGKRVRVSKYCWLLATACIWVTASLLDLAAAQNVERHNFPPRIKYEIPAGTKYSESSALMLASCQPAESGYFGGTYGNPIKLQYGFEMESNRNAKVEDALDVLENRVINAVVTTTFPELCFSRRRMEKAAKGKHVSGFRFMQKTEVDFNLPCVSRLHSLNVCGSYKNSIWVYGTQDPGALLSVIDTIQTTLSSSLVAVSRHGIVRLQRSNELTTKIDGSSIPANSSLRGTSDISAGSKIGLVIAILALLAGVSVLAYYVHLDHSSNQTFSSSRTRTSGSDSERSHPDMHAWVSSFWRDRRERQARASAEKSASIYEANRDNAQASLNIFQTGLFSRLSLITGQNGAAVENTNSSTSGSSVGTEGDATIPGSDNQNGAISPLQPSRRWSLFWKPTRFIDIPEKDECDSHCHSSIGDETAPSLSRGKVSEILGLLPADDSSVDTDCLYTQYTQQYR